MKEEVEQLTLFVSSEAIDIPSSQPEVKFTSTPSVTDVEVVDVPIRVRPTNLATKVRQKDAIKKAEKYTKGQLYKRIRKLEELANGVYLIRKARKNEKERELCLRDPETGEVEVIGFGIDVYRTPPDRAANEYLIDRGMGKVPQRNEITGADGGGVVVIPWIPG